MVAKICGDGTSSCSAAGKIYPALSKLRDQLQSRGRHGAPLHRETQRHVSKLPGPALAKDEPRLVISITGAKPGPVLFVNAGVHGGEYPAVEAVIRLSNTVDPKKIAGTVILMPVMNLPAFRTRTPFVCPIDNVNPNRVFPGDPTGGYSEQMTHALINEFVV